MIKFIFVVAGCLATLAPLVGQDDQEVLFTVAGDPVTVGEFRYIYTKTNGDNADFSKQSVEEYLDLYERFKLKVARARAMGLDTVAALQQELAGYRRQLADNYLIDRRVTDRLVEQLHTRKQTDIEFSHILLKAPASGDTAALYTRAVALRDRLTPDNFAATAKSVSEDQYSRDKGGRIGFVVAPFPRGLHALEAALYAAPAGRVIGPVRTGAGYHLAIKHGSRPARGELEVAHILIRKGEDIDPATAGQRAAAARAALEAGQSFEAVAREFSEDEKTKNEGGYLGFFGINRYSPVFEEAAFALAADGAISPVVESPVGFHILRRISHRGVQPLVDERPLLEAKVKADGRFAAAKSAMIAATQQKFDLRENPTNYAAFAAGLDADFFTPDWRPTVAAKGQMTLASLGDRELVLADFTDYLLQNLRRRASLRRNHNPAGAAREMYRDWLAAETLTYAESRLEEDFPDFRALMREYREGILLFEATKLEVWDRAGLDTVGLRQFFEENRERYTFERRARVGQYTVRNDGSVDLNDVIAAAGTADGKAVAERFEGADVDYSEDLYETQRLPAGLDMRVGSLSPAVDDLRKGTSTVYRVEEILPARPRELHEARGYVIADYQDRLEREWVAQLRKQFPIKRNKRALAKLIRS